MSKKGGAPKQITVGYKYFMDMHMAICQGPIDDLLEMRTPEVMVWSGGVKLDQEPVKINKPKLFGGDLKQGGVGDAKGHDEVVVCLGQNGITEAIRTQIAKNLDKSLVSSSTGQKITPLIPGYKGVASVFWNSLHYQSNSARPKPWSFKVKRIPFAKGVPDCAWLDAAAKDFGTIVHQGKYDQVDPAILDVGNSQMGLGQLGKSVYNDATPNVLDALGQTFAKVQAAPTVTPPVVTETKTTVGGETKTTVETPQSKSVIEANLKRITTTDPITKQKIITDELDGKSIQFRYKADSGLNYIAGSELVWGSETYVRDSLGTYSTADGKVFPYYLDHFLKYIQDRATNIGNNLVTSVASTLDDKGVQITSVDNLPKTVAPTVSEAPTLVSSAYRVTKLSTIQHVAQLAKSNLYNGKLEGKTIVFYDRNGAKTVGEWWNDKGEFFGTFEINQDWTLPAFPNGLDKDSDKCTAVHKIVWDGKEYKFDSMIPTTYKGGGSTNVPLFLADDGSYFPYELSTRVDSNVTLFGYSKRIFMVYARAGSNVMFNVSQLSIIREDTYSDGSKSSVNSIAGEFKTQFDANPALVIAECLTSKVFGLGYPYSKLDEVSFRASASTLHDEALGISAIWQSSSSVEDFIGLVLQTINAVLYVDPRTAKFVLKLVRAQTEAEKTLSLKANESNIVEVRKFTRIAASDTYNQITVKWTGSVNGKPRSLTLNNPASINLVGGVVAASKEYSMITNDKVARTLAERDLNIMSQPLSSVELVVTREFWDVAIGDVIIWDWAEYGIIGMPLRINAVSYGTREHGDITLQCIEDVFREHETRYIEASPEEWIVKVPDPVLPDAFEVHELNYFEVEKLRNGYRFGKILNDLDDNFGLLGMFVARPHSATTAFDIYAKDLSTNKDHERIDTLRYTPHGTLAEPLSIQPVSVVTLDFIDDVSAIEINGFARIGTEVVRIASFNKETLQISLDRGMAGTFPRAHAIGSKLWFYDNILPDITIQDSFFIGRTFDFRVSTIFGDKTFPITGTDHQGLSRDSATVTAVHAIPQTPGFLRIGGVYRSQELQIGAVEVSWSDRDTRTNMDVLLRQTDLSNLRLSGLYYAVKVYAQDGVTVLEQDDFVNGNTYTYTFSENNLEGDYIYFLVSAVIGDKVSAPAYMPVKISSTTPVEREFLTYGAISTITPDIASLVEVNNLQPTEESLDGTYVDELANTVYQYKGKDKVKIKWNCNAEDVLNQTKIFAEEVKNAWFNTYVVKVYSAAEEVLASYPATGEKITEAALTFTAPQRKFILGVAVKDNRNTLSTEARIIVDNPEPVIQDIVVKTTVLDPDKKTGTVTLEAQVSKDCQSVQLWVQDSQAWSQVLGEPSYTSNVDSTKLTATFNIAMASSKVIFLKARAVDDFGAGTLSDEFIHDIIVHSADWSGSIFGRPADSLLLNGNVVEEFIEKDNWAVATLVTDVAVPVVDASLDDNGVTFLEVQAAQVNSAPVRSAAIIRFNEIVPLDNLGTYSIQVKYKGQFTGTVKFGVELIGDTQPVENTLTLPTAVEFTPREYLLSIADIRNPKLRQYRPIVIVDITAGSVLIDKISTTLVSDDWSDIDFKSASAIPLSTLAANNDAMALGLDWDTDEHFSSWVPSLLDSTASAKKIKGLNKVELANGVTSLSKEVMFTKAFIPGTFVTGSVTFTRAKQANWDSDAVVTPSITATLYHTLDKTDKTEVTITSATIGASGTSIRIPKFLVNPASVKPVWGIKIALGVQTTAGKKSFITVSGLNVDFLDFSLEDKKIKVNDTSGVITVSGIGCDKNLTPSKITYSSTEPSVIGKEAGELWIDDFGNVFVLRVLVKGDYGYNEQYPVRWEPSTQMSAPKSLTGYIGYVVQDAGDTLPVSVTSAVSATFQPSLAKVDQTKHLVGIDILGIVEGQIPLKLFNNGTWTTVDSIGVADLELVNHYFVLDIETNTLLKYSAATGKFVTSQIPLSAIPDGTKFYNPLTYSTYVMQDGKWEIRPQGIAPGTEIITNDLTTLAEWINANAGNDTNFNPITLKPSFKPLGVGSIYTSGIGNGTSRINLEWDFDAAGNELIDGFAIAHITSETPLTNATAFNAVTATKFPGDYIKNPAARATEIVVQSNLYHYFWIRAYRITNKASDTNPNRIIFSDNDVTNADKMYAVQPVVTHALQIGGVNLANLEDSVKNFSDNLVITALEKRVIWREYQKALGLAQTVADRKAEILTVLNSNPALMAIFTDAENAVTQMTTRLVTDMYPEVQNPQEKASGAPLLKSLLFNGDTSYKVSDNSVAKTGVIVANLAHAIPTITFMDETVLGTLDKLNAALNTHYLVKADEQSAALDLIPMLSDLVVDVNEVSKLKDVFLRATVDYNKALDLSALSKTDSTGMVAAYNDLKAGLLAPRFTLSDAGVVSQTATTPLLPEANGGISSTLRRKFVDRDEAKAFYLKVDTWLDTIKSFFVTVEADRKALVDSVHNTFPANTATHKEVLSVIDTENVLKLTAGMQKLLFNWTSQAWLNAHSKAMAKRGITDTLTPVMNGTLATLLSSNRDVYSEDTHTLAAGSTTINTFKPNKSFIVLQSVAQLRALFDVIVDLNDKQDAINEALGSAPQNYSGAVDPATYFSNSAILVVVGDTYYNTTTKITYRWDGTSWTVGSTSPDATVVIDGETVDFATVFNLALNYSNDTIISPKEKIELQKLYDAMILDNPKFTEDIARYGIVTNYATAYSALKAYLEARYPIIRTRDWKNDTITYQGQPKTLHSYLLGTDKKVYYDATGADTYLNNSYEAKTRYSRVVTSEYAAVIKTYLDSVTALRIAISNAARVTIDPEAVIDKGTPEAPDPVTLVSYVKSLDSILDDDVIVYKEKMTAVTGLKAILDDAKAEHLDVLERYRYYGVSASSYQAAYDALVTALEVTRYQICIMPSKKIIPNRFSRLLGDENDEYDAITGGNINNTAGTAYKSCYRKSHLISDIAAFKLVISNYQTQRNIASKLGLRGIYTGSATSVSQIDYPKVPGSVYWNPTTKKLYGVRTIIWTAIVTLESANESYGDLVEGAKPSKNSVYVKFYDTKNGLYYTRKKTSAEWELTPIITQLKVSGSTPPSRG